jgi:hypothetical protein
MPRPIVVATAALATAVTLVLLLAPTVATPALAASDSALFSFTKGFGERPFTGTTITVTGKADPASGSIHIVRSDGLDGCSADVNPVTGAFSCDLVAGPSTASLTLSA